MFQSEEQIRQDIVTPDGEEEFQIRFIRNEQVGVLTTRSEKSWFILDSKDYWYDLIQQSYPTKQKCRCKNDFFRLTFDYAPRLNTEDYRSVALSARCTACGKEKKLGTMEVDFSPSAHLYTHPLTFCPQPKLKCRTYTIQGYWTEAQLRALTDFLLRSQPYLYCWYFQQPERKRCLRQLTTQELDKFLYDGGSFLKILFSSEPLNTLQTPQAADGRGIYVPDAIWRKREVFQLNSPFLVVGYGDFYSIDFCSEYIDQDGQVRAKSEPFSRLVQDFRAYSQKALRQA